MQLDNLLTPERTLCRASAANKQQVLANKHEVLESCAQFFCESIRLCESFSTDSGSNLPALSSDLLLQSLLARERLGSTGLGNGVAIPHCRLKNIDHVIGALITLAEPIDFDAIDGKPVDIIFILLAPAQALQEHLNALATLAELCNRAEFRQNLRSASTAEQLYRAAIEFRK